MGCTRVVERVCASVGLLSEAPSQFENAESVAQGGVLWALPALLANGLLRHAGTYFHLPKGFYSLIQVLLLLEIPGRPTRLPGFYLAYGDCTAMRESVALETG